MNILASKRHHKLRLALKSIAATGLILSNLLAGFPLQSLFDVYSNMTQDQKVVDALYWATKNEKVVDSLMVDGRPQIINQANAAPDGTGMLIYNEDNANLIAPHYRTWSPSDLSNEANMRDDGNLHEDANHTLVEASPTRDEYIKATLDASGVLNVQVFNGTSWSLGTGAPFEGNFTEAIGRTDDVLRIFDLAYETTSGDAMVVYEDTTTDNKSLKYRTWNGTTWSAEGTLDYTAVAEGAANDQAEWVELERRTTSGANEIMLGWKDITGDGMYGAIWDGDSWEDIALINGAGINIPRRPFDLAWEGTSDQGMILYGTGTTTDFSVYDISNSAWADGTGSTNPGAAVNWIMAAGDPNTDFIAVIVIDNAASGSYDLSVDMWNGTDWTTIAVPTEDVDINNFGFSQGADVIWEHTGDRALFVWRDGTVSETALAYMVYDRSAAAFQAIDDNVICLLTEGGAGTTETVTSLANVEDSAGPCTGMGAWAGTTSGIKLSADPSSSDIMVVAQNETALDLRPEAQLWNGDANGSWLTQTANMGALETDAAPGALATAAIPIRAYDYAWRVNSANNTGLFVYEEDGANVAQPPHYRTWNGTDFSAESNQIDYITMTNSETTANILEAAPTRDEYLAGRLTADGHLNVQLWDGDSWEFGTGSAEKGIFSKTIGNTNALYRVFDIAYETTSGDAMVVYENSSTADGQLKYRTWDGSTWSVENTLDYSAIDESANVAGWVELESRKLGNEIMLGWVDQANDTVFAAVWDGDSWEDVSSINTAGSTSSQQYFDVAWEGTSDQGMILYGTGTTTDFSVYDISNSAWADGTGSTNPGAAAVWVSIANDPSSDYIAAIVIDTISTSSADIQVDIWNGTDWTTIAVPTADADVDNNGFSQGADVAWEQNNSGGRALFMWREDTTNTTLQYMVYNRTSNQFQAIDDNVNCLLTEGGAGTIEVVTAIDNVEDTAGPCSGLGTWAGTVSGIILKPDPSSNIIALVAQNETTLDVRPEMQLWNGDANGSWLTQTTNMGAFEIDAALGTLPNATTPTLPYYFAFNRSDGGGASPTFSLSAYRWYVDTDAENVTDPWGTPNLAENTLINILPAVNDPPVSSTELRLRTALTVNTSNLSASSQQFKLQYKAGTDASCTTGSWSDVGAGGSGTIWRFATSSVTDGTALTALKLTAADILEVYSKANPTVTNPNSATTTQDIEYDFHLQHNAAVDATTYSFRVVESDGTVLDSYTACPTLVTAPGTGNVMRHGGIFSEQSKRGYFWAN